MKKPNTNAKAKGLASLGKLLGTNQSEEFEVETTLPVDPNSPINAGEGLDMSIWKATMDRKARSLDDIAEELKPFGFDRRDVKDRVVYLTNNKHWFDRSGKSGETTYAMKKTTKMPGTEKRKGFLLTQPEAMIAGEENFVDMTREFQQQIHLQESLREEQESVAPEPAMEAVAEPVAVPVVEAVQEAPVEEVKTQDSNDHHIDPKEGLRTCIWKIMHDYKLYTTTDIVTLLEVFGVPKTTVVTLLSHLNVHSNWFDVEIDDKKVRHLRLRPTVMKPENDTPYRPAAKPQAPVNAPAQQDLNLDVKPEEPAVKAPRVLSRGDAVKFGELDLGDVFISPGKEPHHYFVKTDTKLGYLLGHVLGPEPFSDDEVVQFIAKASDQIAMEDVFDILATSSQLEIVRATSEVALSEKDIAAAQRGTDITTRAKRGLGEMRYDPTTPLEEIPSCHCGRTRGVFMLGNYCDTCHTTVKVAHPDMVGPRGVMSDMDARSFDLGAVHFDPNWVLPQPSFKARQQPVRAYGESEVRIAASYSGANMPKFEQPKPKAEETLGFGSDLVKMVIRVGKVELTPDQAILVARALVAQGYGMKRNTARTDSELVQFPVVIAGETFTQEQAQEIATTLIKAGFSV